MSWDNQKWYETTIRLPDDGLEVWTRLDRWAGTPFKAIYNALDMTFISVNNDLVIPAYIVAAFRVDSLPLLLLDGIEGVVGVFSLRRLLSNYKGDSITVRNNTTQVQTQVPFLNDYINTDFLLSLTSGNILSLFRWYNQKAESNFLIQSDGTRQPIIFNGTNLFTNEGKLYINFQNKKMSSSWIINTSPYTIISVLKNDFLTGTRTIAMQRTSAVNNGSGILQYQSGNKQAATRKDGTNIIATSSQINTTNYTIYHVRCDGPTVVFGINGIEVSSQSFKDIAFEEVDFFIGGRWDNSDYYSGQMTEILVFNRKLEEEFDIIINDIKTFYSIDV